MFYYTNGFIVLLALFSQIASAQTTSSTVYIADDVVGDYECVKYEGICQPVGTFYEKDPDLVCKGKRVASPLTFEKINATTVRITMTDHTSSEGCVKHGMTVGPTSTKSVLEMTGKIEGRYIVTKGMGRMTVLTASVKTAAYSQAAQTYEHNIPQQRTYEIMDNGQLKHVIEQTGKVHVYRKM